MQVEHICVGMADDYGNRRWRKGVLTLRLPNEIMGSGYSHTCDMPNNSDKDLMGHIYVVMIDSIRRILFNQMGL